MRLLCSIENCGKPVRARGWCNAHWCRWRRHGDPCGGGTFIGEPERFLREVVLTYDGTDCLIWPYSKHGAGYAQIRDKEGKNRPVARLVCEERHGPPPTPDHEAAHSCGNGHEACVTKRHLDWKTHAGNMADTLLHGTHNRGERNGVSRLTEPEARAILALKGQMAPRAIADRFDVSQATVWAIHRRDRWAWI